MTREHLEAIEDKIRQAIEFAKQQGWKIDPEAWFRLGDTKTCCPLGACLVSEYPEDQVQVFCDPLNGKRLMPMPSGLPDDFINGFVGGFDNSSPILGQMEEGTDYEQGYSMGNRFRVDFDSGIL